MASLGSSGRGNRALRRFRKLFASRFMPCPECGASVDRADTTPHTCHPDQLLEYRMFGLRHEIAWLDRLVASYLRRPRAASRPGSRPATYVGPRPDRLGSAGCASPPGT